MKRKVMLVEDEELILQGLKNIIDWEANEMEVVITAGNGEEALELMEGKSVDLIVTDIQMPVMDGLTLLKEIRQTDTRARCIILTGYDEFEYARKAIHLDVEEYILKPINEDQLLDALLKACEKLKKQEQWFSENIEENTVWTRFLQGNLSADEAGIYTELLPEIFPGEMVYPALMNLSLNSLKETRISDILARLRTEDEKVRVIYLSSDTLLLLLYGADLDEGSAVDAFMNLQADLESEFGVLCFISLGSGISDYTLLPEAYTEARKLQKYKMIEGYGACISPEMIDNRKSQDIQIQNTFLQRSIFKRNKEEALRYVEDLFINNVRKDAAVEDIYRMALEVAMLLQDVKSEYKLTEHTSMHNLAEIMEQICQAEDIFTLKTIFIGEIISIISCLSEDQSQYTPVVKQIMTDVELNYKEDMNLKTLAHKYHMNASYLGQIFQKEVGCSFAQYLSNTKNSIAKNLILNTNMRIIDIAREVGYPDTSYFYRKFKQCYGVSPATLREMKHY